MAAPPADPGSRDPGLARFYAHLVAVTAVQLGTLVIGLAQGAVAGWYAAVVLAGALGLAAHAATTLPLRLRGDRSRDSGLS